MDEPQSLDAELFQAVLVEAVRSGAIPIDIVQRVRARYEAAEGDRAERLTAMATEIELQAQAPAVSDFVAEKRRRQMRLRAQHTASKAGDPP